MTGKEYQQLAKRTIRSDFTLNDMLWNGGMGLCGEAGEVIEIIKKFTWHGRQLNREDMIKEMGDVLWYLAELCNSIGTDLDEVMEKNIEKLKERYPNGFNISPVV